MLNVIYGLEYKRDNYININICIQCINSTEWWSRLHMFLSTQLHNFEGPVEAEELVKNLSIVKHFLSRDSERSAQAGLRKKGPIISLGIWTKQPNDEEDQMLSHQRSEPVCARAKRRPITKKGFYPAGAFTSSCGTWWLHLDSGLPEITNLSDGPTSHQTRSNVLSKPHDRSVT